MFGYCLSGISLSVLPLPVTVRLILLALLLASLSYQLSKIVRPNFIGLQLLARELLLIKRDGQILKLTQTTSTLVMPSLIILHGVTAEGHRKSLLLMSDSLEKQAFRRLRILLRWGS